MKRYGKEIKMTKEEMIEWHRKQWKTIAEKWENGVIYTERDFLKENGFHDVDRNSFCCEYDLQKLIETNDDTKDVYDCCYCPMKWSSTGSGMCRVEMGRYDRLLEMKNSWSSEEKWMECVAEVAREIENLLER